MEAQRNTHTNTEPKRTREKQRERAPNLTKESLAYENGELANTSILLISVKTTSFH